MEWDIQKITEIHFFGDSLTAGYGTTPENGWVPELGRRCTSLKYYNHGVCGTVLSDIYDSMMPFLSQRNITTGFFFMGGTNDILLGYNVKYVQKTLDQIIFSLCHSTPLCIGIPTLMTVRSIETGWQSDFAFPKNNRDLIEYGNHIKSICIKQSIPFIDFASSFPLDDAWYSDGIHPNDKGYRRFADIAEHLLTKHK